MQGSLTAEGIKGFVPSESVAMMLLVLKNRKGEALRSFTAVKIGTNIGISTPSIATNSYCLVAVCCVSPMRSKWEKYFRKPFPGCQRWIPINPAFRF
jgi:hypothetical protein